MDPDIIRFFAFPLDTPVITSTLYSFIRTLRSNDKALLDPSSTEAAGG